MSAESSPVGWDRPSFTLDDFRSDERAMARCLDLARVAARTDLPILILGETGTGKSLLARAIHNSSVRANLPFVAFNAAALSESLLDSQLFGHERGAFTGADRLVKGKFELADGGTLFIDEIADMSLPAQAKILRAVEQGEFERLGGERLRSANVRLLTATHVTVAEFLSGSGFRKDLFYRLSGLTVTIPPLRERRADLPALIASKIRDAAVHCGIEIEGLDHEAADLVFGYSWPGNLRELDRVIQAAVSVTTPPIVTADAIRLASPGIAAGRSGAVREAARDLRLDTVVRRHVDEVLRHAGGNKRQTARILGVSRSTLDRKLR
ncbi:MAG: two-component system, NtrC family, response regulator AtoC [Candidatus Binatota bacterium]|nr:two-component system, NtrC family, response regulator AtoC [Candidatus Binatota bacterium]